MFLEKSVWKAFIIFFIILIGELNFQEMPENLQFNTLALSNVRVRVSVVRR